MGELSEKEKELIEERIRQMHTDKYKITGTTCINLSEEERKKLQDTQAILQDSYLKISQTLREYMILREDYYSLISVWIIGTYFYNEFLTYPYLFINAMRGSGKSRLLKLIKALSWNGEMLLSMREAVLFRIASEHTLCIDEFENIGTRENSALREVLNAGYKKGGKVTRMKKVYSASGEVQIPETFNVFSPKVMANIWGMEEILADRAITMILEKNIKDFRSKLSEDFENDLMVQNIKANLKLDLVYMCSYFGERGVYRVWNEWLKLYYNYTTTHTTPSTLTTQTTLNLINNITLEEFFLKVDKSGLNGRDLELFFPIFMIAKVISEELFDEMIEVAKKIQKEKRVEELTESRDILFLEFIADQEDNNQFKQVNELTSMFRYQLGEEEENKWITTQWIGRAIKRLNLAIEKRRIAKGVEVHLNVKKAKEKLDMIKY